MFVFARFRAANHQFAAEEFFVVQFFHRPFCFLDSLHLNEGKAFRSLIMAIAHHLGVLHVADAVKQLEQVALGRVERQIAYVKPRRRNFYGLRFTLWARLPLR